MGLSDRARAAIHPSYADTSELLPVTVGDQHMGILNVTLVVDCLNWSQTQPKIGAPKAWAFHQDALPVGKMFKIPEFSRGQVLYCDQTSDGETPLSELLRSSRLTGLDLELLWDTSHGPYPEVPSW